MIIPALLKLLVHRFPVDFRYFTYFQDVTSLVVKFKVKKFFISKISEVGTRLLWDRHGPLGSPYSW